MVTILPDPEFRQHLLEKIAQREFKERVGIHCSDLLYCINKQALRRKTNLPVPNHTLLLFSLGWASQRWLTGKDEDEPARELDGITVTLDAVDTKGRPWELKASYQSSSRDILENLSWIRQIMAQCKVSGKTEAFLSRFEIMGDWASVFPKGATPAEKKANKEAAKKPTLSAYKLVFTQDEIDRNWEWLKQRRDLFAEVLRTGVLLPKAQAIPPTQEWECSDCPFRGGECGLS